MFGRDREEMLCAEQRGLRTEYVPDISSAVAAAGCLDSPATHRRLSEGVRVLAATTADGQLSGTMADLAARTARAGLGAPAIIVVGEVVRLATVPAAKAAAPAWQTALQALLLPYAKVA